MEYWSGGKLCYSHYHSFDKTAHYSRNSYPFFFPSRDCVAIAEHAQMSF
jgi:hypothetical protein